jgi:hypothetical protein
MMLFGGLIVFVLALASTAVYTYTPELYPTEIPATGIGLGGRSLRRARHARSKPAGSYPPRLKPL